MANLIRNLASSLRRNNPVPQTAEEGRAAAERYIKQFQRTGTYDVGGIKMGTSDSDGGVRAVGAAARDEIRNAFRQLSVNLNQKGDQLRKQAEEARAKGNIRRANQLAKQARETYGKAGDAAREAAVWASGAKKINESQQKAARRAVAPTKPQAPAAPNRAKGRKKQTG